MRRSILVLLLFLFTSAAYAQNGGYVNISNEKPIIGDNLTITYNPKGDKALLKNAKEIIACVCALQSNGSSEIEEIILKGLKNELRKSNNR